MNYKEFTNPNVIACMKKIRRVAEEKSVVWMSSTSKGLSVELGTLKSLASQIARGEITFSSDYKDSPSAIKANMSLYASDLLRIAALLEFLLIESEEIDE